MSKNVVSVNYDVNKRANSSGVLLLSIRPLGASRNATLTPPLTPSWFGKSPLPRRKWSLWKFMCEACVRLLSIAHETGQWIRSDEKMANLRNSREISRPLWRRRVDHRDAESDYVVMMMSRQEHEHEHDLEAILLWNLQFWLVVDPGRQITGLY